MDAVNAHREESRSDWVWAGSGRLLKKAVTVKLGLKRGRFLASKKKKKKMRVSKSGWAYAVVRFSTTKIYSSCKR